MFITKNCKARKYFVGRRLAKEIDGVNIFYSVPVSKKEHKASRLTLVRHSGKTKTKMDLNGTEVLQLRRILNKAQKLMNWDYSN